MFRGFLNRWNRLDDSYDRCYDTCSCDECHSENNDGVGEMPLWKVILSAIFKRVI